MDAELANELFGLMVFPNFIIKSLEGVEAIHLPLHAGTDQPARMCPASLDAQRDGKVWGLVFQSLHFPDVIPLFLSCFTSQCGQEAGAATLRHWDHGCPHHPSQYLHQSVPSTVKKTQAATLVSPRTHHHL